MSSAESFSVSVIPDSRQSLPLPPPPQPLPLDNPPTAPCGETTDWPYLASNGIFFHSILFSQLLPLLPSSQACNTSLWESLAVLATPGWLYVFQLFKFDVAPCVFYLTTSLGHRSNPGPKIKCPWNQNRNDNTYIPGIL